LRRKNNTSQKKIMTKQEEKERERRERGKRTKAKERSK
jgi:hypothetical protein